MFVYVTYNVKPLLFKVQKKDVSILLNLISYTTRINICSLTIQMAHQSNSIQIILDLQPIYLITRRKRKRIM